MILKAEPPGSALTGALRPPGDKSISHRALIMAGLADGRSLLEGVLLSADTLATLRAMEQLGASFSEEEGMLRVAGVGAEGLVAPRAPLDMGNSGTAMRLLAGVLAAQPLESILVGDASLSSRPMARIIRPLERMGARIVAAPGGTAPLKIHGNPELRGIDYNSSVASAQVKSCVLLAGLYASGRTSVKEPSLSRDHTERMLPVFGVAVDDTAVRGGSRLQGAHVGVPADPSSAAFLVAAALLVPGSDLALAGVGVNATRIGFFRILAAMGADLTIGREGLLGGEPVADLGVRYSGPLRGVDVPPECIPALIDEVPVLIALAACARGVTRIRGAAELRVKESDRLAVMGRALAAMGIQHEEREDGIDVVGGAPASARVDAAGDHRCAMSLAVLGQAVTGGLRIAGAGLIDTSYPGFAAHLEQIGGSISFAEGTV